MPAVSRFILSVTTTKTTKRQRGEGNADLMSLDDDYKEDKDDLDSDEVDSEEEVRRCIVYKYLTKCASYIHRAVNKLRGVLPFVLDPESG